MSSNQPLLPAIEVPGSYGLPFFGAFRDRLDYFYFKGVDAYFQSKVDQAGSTVVRLNVPPGPFMASNPGVIAVLDAKSFPVLFDMSKVEKKNILTGTYMPSTKLTGGYRVCSYLDPSEPNHTKVKTLLFAILVDRKDAVVPTFRTNFTALFETMESQLASAGKSDFNALNDFTSLDFLGDAYFGVKPSSTALGTKGQTKALTWLMLQLCPIMTLGLPKVFNFLEDLALHTFHLPPFIAKGAYNALYSYFEAASAPYLQKAEKLGLSKEEACHNLLFATLLNSYGGFKLFFPGLLGLLAKADRSLHDRLKDEIRSAVAAEGGEVTLAAIEKMELTKSVVYEALRMDPPVKFQYGKAMTDLVVESHDSSYKIKKGETIFGYQPFATKDPKVFVDADKFIGDRFVGEEGKKLIKYVVWSNGPETEEPTVQNKQCPAKDFVVLSGRLLVVEFFLRYDTFKADVGTFILGQKVTVTSTTKATT